ncbi:MAG: STAS domain-containing protein [Verrucomicrobia bacterium]|nr:STAS domain-containing protein [Verrucomicrobiota bacterium]
MKTQHDGETLHISDILELSAANSRAFRDQVNAALPAALKTIEIDLSQTSFVDSCGLGALIAVYKAAAGRDGGIILRLLNPTPPVQQLFELTRLHHLFEIARR